ncbi:MAG: redoxin domain-containing protein [Deltaproteobacteria bacterium]|nr:redoxin domain-containing protein [Deltaproteobacteria bacterium]
MLRIFLFQKSFVILLSVLILFHGGKLYSGEAMPFHLKVVDSAGKETTLENLRGRKVVLVVYTSSMSDCKRHLERFVTLSEDFMGEDVLFSIVDITPLGYEEFLSNLPDNKGNAIFRKDLDGNIARILDVIFLPTTFFISEEGEVLERHESLHLWDSTEFKVSVKKFIEAGS